MNSYSMTNTAFAAPAALSSFTSIPGSSMCTRLTHNSRAVVAPTTMLSGDKRAFSNKLMNEKDRVAAVKEAEYRGPQGWTAYAEKVNGRMAQLGFVVGLVTEIVSGKPIGEQILIMFSPLVAAANEITVLGAQAAHLIQHLN